MYPIENLIISTEQIVEPNQFPYANLPIVTDICRLAKTK
jgi:hypothetical protein